MASIFSGLKRKRDTDNDHRVESMTRDCSRRAHVGDHNDDSTASDVKTILKQQKKEDGKMRAQARAALAKAAKLRQLLHYNKLILDMGNTRGLYGYALAAFNEMLENKIEPNKFTFANILNACARASEVDTARKLFADMDRYKIEKDEIIYTILMKTYCNAGRVEEAILILDEMEKARVVPNVRSFQTLLRECMHASNLELANKVLSKLHECGLKPTAVMLEHMSRIHAMRLDVPAAMECFQRLQDLLLQNETNDQVFHLDMLPVSVAACGAAIANACFVLNDIKTGRRILSQARAAIDQVRERNGATKQTPWWKLKEQAKGKFRDNSPPVEKPEEEKEKKDRVVYARSHDFTTHQFTALREKETEHEIYRLETYVKTLAALQQTTAANVLRDEKTSSSQWRATGVLTKGLTQAQRVYLVKDMPRDTPDATRKEARKINGELPFDWERIFRNQNPIRVEVCSGVGEWVCERARKTPDVNWVAVEMSPERVFQIWSRAQLMHLQNLVIVSGEATYTLANCFAPGTVQQIYVNFPEPPVWGGWVFRLLKEEFFAACNVVLTKARRSKKGSDTDDEDDLVGDSGQGFVTILTDDAGYAWTLHRELSPEGRSGHLFKTMLRSNELFSCEVPAHYGSSYYDRFWDNGSKKRRCYFKLGKVKQ